MKPVTTTCALCGDSVEGVVLEGILRASCRRCLVGIAYERREVTDYVLRPEWWAESLAIYLTVDGEPQPRCFRLGAGDVDSVDAAATLNGMLHFAALGLTASVTPSGALEIRRGNGTFVVERGPR